MENAVNKPNDGGQDAPKLDHPLWVQCEGFRCLGYKDAKGVWHNSFTGELLPKVIGILEL